MTATTATPAYDVAPAPSTGSRAHRQVGFKEAVRLFFANAFDFKGRSSRGAYWWFALAYYAALIPTFAVVFTVAAIVPPAGMVLMGLVFLALLAAFIPALSLAVRRLHDTGRSGWWIAPTFIPYVGIVFSIVLLVFLCQPGKRETNKFGPDVEAGRSQSVGEIFA